MRAAYASVAPIPPHYCRRIAAATQPESFQKTAAGCLQRSLVRVSPEAAQFNNHVSNRRNDMGIRERNRWKWCLRAGKTLLLGAALVCFGQAGTASAQCMGGGTATTAATGGTAATALGGAATQFTAVQAQAQALQQLAAQARMQAQMQAQLEMMRAQQQLAAQQRQLAAQQREDSARERREEFARMVDAADGTTCAASARRSGNAVRNTFAARAARTTERELQVARMLARESERQAALQERIAERDAELALRRERALAQE
jgi:hypothetical protein